MAINANTELYDRIIDRAAMVRLFERRVAGRVELILDGHAVRVDKLVNDANFSTAGFLIFREAVDKEIKKTYTDAFRSTKNDLLGLASDQASFTYGGVEKLFGDIWKTERPNRRIAEEIVLERPLHEEKTLAQGWAGISEGEKIRIESAIRRGLAEGNTNSELAKSVRAISAISKNQAAALVTTAVTSVTNQADHEIYKANEKAISGWQYVAVLDSRTTPICAHRDGQIYPIGDTEHLPPAHYRCRSTTTPVLKSWDDMGKLEAVAQVRKRNLGSLTKDQQAYYDGMLPLHESYNDWLLRQPKQTQLRHLGDYKKVEMFNTGQLTVDKFSNPEGNTVGLNELRQITDSTYTIPNDTMRFANAKAKLDAMQLHATMPEDFFSDPALTQTLKDYYLLQAGELDGTLSLTNFRGALIGNKKAMKRRVLTSLPREDQMIFNPVTGRYEDTRLYQPNLGVLNNNLKLIRNSPDLKQVDKDFIVTFVEGLNEKMGANERAVIADNLRIVFTRYRKNGERWGNFKAVSQSQIKFDVMNVSDSIETQIRSGSDPLKKLLQDNYIDPVLGPTQLQDLHDNFIGNIKAKNLWEDRTAPKIARELRDAFDRHIPLIINHRLDEASKQMFYLRFANRLSLADTPDRDQLAIALGRDLYNQANLNGTKDKWYETGLALLEGNTDLFEVETFGVQKRRMKSRMSGNLFGPYYDTLAYNIRVTDPRVQEYSHLTRKVELGLRVAVTKPENRLKFREGYKTYFTEDNYDTRIPITSTSSFSDFPESFVDKNTVDALNWASQTEYRVDPDFYDAVQKVLYFVDDRGKAKFYDGLNEYKHYIAGRGDAYERFKSMEWLRKSGDSFSNNPFIDHRARIYDRGLISPQSGESFRPFLNTKEEKILGYDGYLNFRDQTGAFLGGLTDAFEGKDNSLTFTGRQKIADRLWPEMVDVGNKLMRGKPADIRGVLESSMVQQVEGEELGKFFRFAMEAAKIDNYLKDGTSAAVSEVVSTPGLLSERQDAAGLVRLLGVNNKTDPDYISSPAEVIQAQSDLLRLASEGKLTSKDVGEAFKWLHTADISLTKERMERATYKTFDQATGEKFSAAKVAENKAKFEQRSKGDTPRYIAMQVVEELGEFMEEHLKSASVPRSARVFKLIEAQKRALKAERFGAATVIKDADSPYFMKTNQEAALIAANDAGLKVVPGDAIGLIERLNKEIGAESVKALAAPRATDVVAKMNSYKTALALEQDASSSGAQIIALATKNKQLAELSNVVPTTQKRRLYDEIAAATYNDPRFKVMNERLGLSEKDLRKAAKAQNMVTFYGAGERTGILNVEGKLAKILEKQGNTLVVKASERDTILDEISARAARYKSYDPDTFDELMTLRANVRDIFNKGLDPGDEIMEQLYFLDPGNRALVEKMSATYDLVVTPKDFKDIANIMSDHLGEQVPILKDFTKFFGRLAEDYLRHAKPKNADFDWKAIGEITLFGERKKGKTVDRVVGDLLGLDNKVKVLFGSRFSEMLGVDPKTPLTEQVLKRFSWFKPDSTLADILLGGKQASTDRRTGAKYAKIELFQILDVTKGFQLFYSNKLPKSWTNVPWVNFDGKVLEQNFTQAFEEKLLYKDKDGNTVMNVIQVPQKTEATWWEQIINKEGKINDIADVTKARTAYAVNGNHSNDKQSCRFKTL
jgi:SPP1 gp7 family putative phage head morphogenesis protein